MSAVEFMRFADGGLNRSETTRFIKPINNEYKAAVMAMIPASDSSVAVTSLDLVAQIDAYDPLGVSEHRPPVDLQEKLAFWVERHYLDVVGEDHEGRIAVRRNKLGDRTAEFAAAMLLADHKHQVAMQPVIGNAYFDNDTSVWANRDPVAARMPVLGLFSAAEPQAWLPSKDIFAGALLAGCSRKSARSALEGLTGAKVIEKMDTPVRGATVRASYRIRTGVTEDYPSFIEAYLQNVITLMDGKSLEVGDPGKVVKRLAEKGAFGYLIKRAQDNSNKFNACPVKK